jgi:hypothetical protein
MASTRTDPEVRIDPPPQDSQSLAEAQRLADKVCAELADLEYETTLDKYMTTVRGRAWLS